MSTTIDQRVVQMQFDNAQFEQAVQQTLNSLNRLNQAIDQNTANSGKAAFGDLGSKFNLANFQLAKIGDTAEKVKSKFSILGTAADQFTRNISSRLEGAAWNMTKTLTGINSVTDGFSRFNQKTQAVSTLMTATGASMEKVNATLEDLQWFTDQTSYNFTDMIDTMSKLTASGQKDLGKLLRFTEGFALAAAKAGVGAEKTSHAMYQLTQAASRGYIQYQDWQQALGQTNIATADLKQRMIEAGGEAAKAANAYGDFNGSLKKGWLTMDVFSSVMDDFSQGINKANYDLGEDGFVKSCTGAADSTTKFSEQAFRCAQECRSWEDVVNAVKDALGTGWSDSFTQILGDTKEVKGLFTGLANAAINVGTQISDWRNKLLASWKALGGRNDLLQTLANSLNVIKSIIEPIRRAFVEVFGELTPKSLKGATGSIEAFTRGLILTGKQMSHLKSVFVDIFTAIKKGFGYIKLYGKQIINFLLIVSVLKSIKSLLVGGLGLNTISSILKLIISWNLLKHLNGAQNGVQLLAGGLGGLLNILSKLQQKIAGNKVLNGIATGIRVVVRLIIILVAAIIKGISTIVGAIKNANIPAFFSSIKDKFVDLVNYIGNAKPFSKLGSTLGKVFGGIFSTVSGLIGKIKDKIFSTVTGIKPDGMLGNLKNGKSGARVFLDGLLSIFSAIKDHFTDLGKELSGKSFVGKLQTIGSDIVKIVKNAFESIKSINILSVLKNLGSEILKLFNKLFNSIKSAKVGDKIKDFFTTIGQFIEKALTKIFGEDKTKKIVGFFTSIINLFKAFGITLKNFISQLDFSGFKFNTPFKKVSEDAQNATADVKTLGDTFKKFSWKSFFGNGLMKDPSTNSLVGAKASLIDLANTSADTSKKVNDNTSKMFGGLKKVSANVGSVGDAFERAGNGITNFFKSMQDTLDTLKETNPVIRDIVNFLTNVDWEKVLVIGYLITYLLIMRKISKAITSVDGTVKKIGDTVETVTGGIRNAFAEMINSIKNLNDSIAAVPKSISKYIDSLTTANKFKNFRDLAIGIGLLAGSLALICALPTDRLWRSVGALAAIVAMADITVAVLGKVSRKVRPEKLYALIAALVAFNATLVTMSILLGLITAVTSHIINTSKSLDETIGKILAPLGVMGGMMTLMIGTLAVIVALAKPIGIAAGAVLKLSGALAAFGASLLVLNFGLAVAVGMCKFIGLEFMLLTKSIVSAFTNAETSEDAWNALSVAVVALIGVFALGAFAAKHLAKANLQLGGSLALIAASVIGIAIAIKTLSEISGDVLNPLIGIIGGMLLLGGALNFFAQDNFTSVADNLRKVGSAMIKMSLSILILTGAIALLGKLKFDELKQGLGAVCSLLLAMGAAVWLMQKANIKGAAAAILSLVIALYMLVPVISIFALAWKQLLPGIVEVTGIMLAMARAIQMMQNAQPAKLIPIMVTMGIVVTLMGSVISSLAKLKDPTSVATAAGALAVAMLAFGGAVKIMSKVMENIATKSKGWKRYIADFLVTIGTFGLVAVLLGQVIHSIASIKDWKSIGAAGAALSAAMMSFGKAISIMTPALSKINKVSKFIPTMAATVGILAAAVIPLSKAISTIGQLPWQQALAASAGISMAMLALGGAVGLMTSFTKNVNVSSLLGLSVVIAALSGGMSLLAVSMNQITAVPWQSILSFLIPLISGMVVLTAVLGVFAPALSAATGAILSISLVIGVVAAGASLLAVAMSQLAGVDYDTILAFIIPFEAGIVGLVVAFGLLGPALDVAIPAILSVAVVFGTVAAIVAAVAAVLQGFAAIANAVGNTIVTVIQLVIQAIQQLTPIIKNFIVFLVQMSGQAAGILKMAGALAVLGVALVPLAAGMTAAGLAGVVLGKGMEVAAKGITALATAIQAAKKTFDDFTSSAKEWGSHIGSNLASGLRTGISGVSGAARELAYQIWYQLHQSEGESGSLLHNVKEWGVHLWQNICSGLTSGNGVVAKVASGLGGFLKKGFEQGTKGTGLEAIGKLVKELGSGETSINSILQSLGLSGGNAFGSSLLSSASSWISQLGNFNFSGMFGGKKGKIKYSGKNKSGYAWKDTTGSDDDDWSDMDWFSADDFSAIADSAGDAGDALGDYAGAADDAGKASGGAGKSASELAEEQAKLAKFMKYSQQVISDFTNSWANMSFIVNDTTPITNAENAFADLAEKIYTDSLDDGFEDPTMSAVERAEKIREAFIQAFEDIKKSAKDALSGFDEFDKGLSNAMSPEEMLSNVKSRFEGVQEFYERLQHLAYKGFSDDVIKDMIDEGVSAYPKVSTMLKMTTDQVEQLNAAYADKDAAAARAASMAMVARMAALELPKLRQRAAGIQNVNEELLNQGLAYKQLEESGTASTEQLTQAQQDLSKAAEASGTTFDQLQATLKDTDAVQAQLTVNAIDNMEKAYDAMKQIEDGAEQIRVGTKEAFESTISIFDKWDESGWDKSGDELLDNMRSQINGIAEMANNLGTVIANGGTPELIIELAQKGAEQVSYAAQWSVDQVAEANSLIQKKLEMPTTLSDQLRDQYINTAMANGMSYAEAFQQFTDAQAKLGGISSAAQSMANSMTQGMDTSLQSGAQQSASKYAQLLATDMQGQSEVVKSAGKTTGQALTEGTQEGIEETKENVSTAAKNTVTEASNDANDKLNDGSAETIGQNWTVGLANGMVNSYAMNAITSHIDSLTSTVKTRTSNGLDEKSPSKLSAKYGNYWTIGLANGIVESISSVANATGTITDVVVDSMANAMSTANDVLSSSDNQPTITPVVDMSKIGTEGQLINDQFAAPINMAVNPQLGNITTQADQLNRSIAGLDVTPDNTDIISAINGLNSRMSDLSYQMKNMQIVLDTGTLVGEMTPQIDSSLGKIYSRRNR